MEETMAKLTVFFEEPFWVGLYELQMGSAYSVCKITFGAEPKDYEVYEFLQKNSQLLYFSPMLYQEKLLVRNINPKRMQREIKRSVKQQGIGTKAQQALKIQQEAGKRSQKARNRERREKEQERRFLLHEEKRKEKHRGH